MSEVNTAMIYKITADYQKPVNFCKVVCAKHFNNAEVIFIIIPAYI